MPGATDSAIRYLRSPAAVRERCAGVLEFVRAGHSPHFVLGLDALETAADVTLQREDDYAAKVVLEHEAEEIQRALKRKQEGCYGICANCGRPIPKERLEARPAAIYCIDCQRLLEGRR